MAAWCSLLTLSLCVFFVAWWFSGRQPSNIYDNPPLINADGSVYFDHKNLLLPSSVEEIIEIVKSAHQHRRTVRVLGAGHSRSAIAHSSDIYLSLYNYTGIVHIDRQSREVAVKAGTLLRDLNTELRENGLALSSLPTLADQTIGGALAVGSHGTGLSYGNMASFVTSISFISGTGKLISVNASSNSTLFSASLVSLGMLGIVTEVTFRCEPQFNLREKITIHTVDDCLENLDHYSSRSDHGKLWMEAHSGTCAVFDVWRTGQPVTLEQEVDLWDLKSRVSEPVLWLGSWLPSLNPQLVSFVYNGLRLFTPYKRVAVSHDGFMVPLYVPSNHQVELIVGMSDCAAALTVWSRLASDNHHSNLFIEVRYVKADDIFLSHNYRRDSCHITVIIYNPSHDVMLDYFHSLFDALSPYSPRIHWAKYLCDLDRHKVESLYPRFLDFDRIRQEMDPHGVFVNHALRKTFGL